MDSFTSQDEGAFTVKYRKHCNIQYRKFTKISQNTRYKIPVVRVVPPRDEAICRRSTRARARTETRSFSARRNYAGNFEAGRRTVHCNRASQLERDYREFYLPAARALSRGVCTQRDRRLVFQLGLAGPREPPSSHCTSISLRATLLPENRFSIT